MAKDTHRKIINGIFIAMSVFTVALIVLTIKNYYDQKKRMTIDPEKVNLVQLDTINKKIADDAPVAIIKTDIGEIRAELYPQYAPETVANFKRLADSGYYDGTFVYEIKEGTFFSGGCMYNDGSLPDGFNKDEECIGPEISIDLWPFKGSFMSVGMTRGTFWRGDIIYSGSRYMVAGSVEFTEELKKEMLEGRDNTKIQDAFINNGGLPGAAQQMTVFAQTYEGFDVIDAIMQKDSDKKTLKPAADIEILKTEVCTYKESLEK